MTLKMVVYCMCIYVEFCEDMETFLKCHYVTQLHIMIVLLRVSLEASKLQKPPPTLSEFTSHCHLLLLCLDFHNTFFKKTSGHHLL